LQGIGGRMTRLVNKIRQFLSGILTVEHRVDILRILRRKR
jgi:hypothetical protein